jgi:hypothetical protein
MSKTGIKIPAQHYIGICSFCHTQKFIYKIVDCVTVICAHCFQNRKKIKYPAGE